MESEHNNQESPSKTLGSLGAEGDGPAAPAGGDPSDAPRRKRRRRRRKKKDGGGSAEVSPEASSETSSEAASGAGAEVSAAAGDPGWQSLATGLFSHLDERQIPCKVDGCDNTWTWTAQEQMQAFGQPPPRRMCGEHRSRFTTLDDREVPCANPGCERTWTWSKKAQSAQLQRSGQGQPPRKVCPGCTAEERELSDREVTCRVDGCERTWTWNREAQLKHRTWARRHAEEDARGGGGDDRSRSRSGKRRRRRRRSSPDVNQPPPRMCKPCNDKLAKLVEREVPCKVHGCTRMAPLDRESQLRAWARLGTEDLEAQGPAARRMCETCRDFCRNHPDRRVSCGRPGCERSWTYKTGAQLQDFLAGRRQDPVRLCSECAKGSLGARAVDAPSGMEVMPCVVPMCDGVWFFRAGVVAVASAPGEELPVDRMCDRCRGERDEPPRRPAAGAPATPPKGSVSAAADAARDVPPGTGAREAADAQDVEGSPTVATLEAEANETAANEAGTSEAAAALGAGAASEATAALEAGAANEPAVANEPTAANEPVAANDGQLVDDSEGARTESPVDDSEGTRTE